MQGPVSCILHRRFLPPDCLLTAILRGNQAEIVSGESRLRADDTVVALTKLAAIKAMRKALLGS